MNSPQCPRAEWIFFGGGDGGGAEGGVRLIEETVPNYQSMNQILYNKVIC